MAKTPPTNKPKSKKSSQRSTPGRTSKSGSTTTSATDFGSNPSQQNGQKKSQSSSPRKNKAKNTTNTVTPASQQKKQYKNSPKKNSYPTKNRQLIPTPTKEELLQNPTQPYSQDPVYDYWNGSSNNEGKFRGSTDASQAIDVLQAGFLPFKIICVSLEYLQIAPSVVDDALALPEYFNLLHKLWVKLHNETNNDQYLSSSISNFGACVEYILRKRKFQEVYNRHPAYKMATGNSPKAEGDNT